PQRETCPETRSYLLATFSGRWNISTSAAALSARRFSPCSYDAPTNVLNKGCGSSGLDLNSGWNWQPIKCGWSGNSTISTYVPSGVDPEIRSPPAVSVLSYSRLNSYRCRCRSLISNLPYTL